MFLRSSRHPPQGHASHARGGDGRSPRRKSSQPDYTLGYGTRQIRFGPVAFWSTVGGLGVMAVWSLACATYFAFRDDVLARLIAHQAHVQYAYEDRIADLRIQVDRLASRQLLDQQQFAEKLDRLLRRESVLESRAATLSSLPDPLTTGSLTPPGSGRNAARHPISRPNTLPIGDRTELPAADDHDVQAVATAGAAIQTRVAALEASLDRIEVQQTGTLAAIEGGYESNAKRIRGVLSDIGMQSPATQKLAASGGPYVPANLVDANSFERRFYRLQVARAEVETLSRTIANVPVRKPIDGEIDMTSGFGIRLDPFLHGAAMHTGIDFRGNVGQPVRATAAGIVTHAGPSGGYGRMVEVDHGNGLATRYAHLTAIEVAAGEKVRAGQVVGTLGSSGRSTGPHLHYETRINGEAADPQRFLRAGSALPPNL